MTQYIRKSIKNPSLLLVLLLLFGFSNSLMFPSIHTSDAYASPDITAPNIIPSAVNTPSNAPITKYRLVIAAAFEMLYNSWRLSSF